MKRNCTNCLQHGLPTVFSFVTFLQVLIPTGQARQVFHKHITRQACGIVAIKRQPCHISRRFLNILCLDECPTQTALAERSDGENGPLFRLWRAGLPTRRQGAEPSSAETPSWTQRSPDDSHNNAPAKISSLRPESPAKIAQNMAKAG